MMQNLYINIKYFLKKTVFLVPFCCLGYSLFSSYYRLQCGDVNITSNSLGYSLIVDFALLYLYWFTSNKFCWLTKFGVLGMIFINLLCISKELFSLSFYTFWFQVFINSLVLFISIIFKFKRL